ncbi:fasciclin domain-containing protein [Chitinophaga arvensicola]|uniref:Uncaracterized surface protein containing fasciclin (FAS1) repeats n=1 Tax=Chitinophaga arvensicola TaxID=29529 RepID=A0A1I0S791_9BACT|nr:fasciclin domain-containing protein [Chitinophaga arvensicola]SEW51608.1 Uncaracterized surface protein containing fasciclin (FAS1) repeats [Chitinophaga arvensicola]
MKRINILIPVMLAAVLCWSGCTKNDADVAGIDNGLITLVVADNFNLSSFGAALRRSGMDATLKTSGPYTALAPSDGAFNAAGFQGIGNILTADRLLMTRIANYHVLEGKYELNRLPYLFNQELRSRGGKLFVTHWIKGEDTVITINGARVLAQNIEASNGLIQVINHVLAPYVHEQLGNAVKAEENITLFAQALITSGQMETINNSGPYTVFAPSNAAMMAIGYTSVQQVSETNPEVLKRLVNYHIIRNRRFIYDYVLSTGSSNTSRQVMLDGNTVNIQLGEDPAEPGRLGTIILSGTGNNTGVNVVKKDILTGNGVLQVIDGVLKITQ